MVMTLLILLFLVKEKMHSFWLEIFDCNRGLLFLCVIEGMMLVVVNWLSDGIVPFLEDFVV